MNHQSIAILRKRKAAAGHDNFDYLVIVDRGQTHSFFESINIAIGGNFDYTSFKQNITEYFELPLEIELADKTKQKVDFETPPHRFKQKRNDPFATAYIYELSKYQAEAIDKHLSSDNIKWSQIKWIDENELSKSTWKENQKFIFDTETPFQQPQFTNEFRASLKNIVTAKNNGKLVIFVGAGISYDSNVPTWGQLIQELRNDLATNEKDFLKVADQYLQSRGKKEYYDKVQSVLNYEKTKFNPLHKKITDLTPIHIITTNYDDHFEQVIERKSLQYSTIRADSDLPFSKGGSLYVKMHGDLGLRNIVLTFSDYKKYSKTFPLIESFVKETFSSKLVLFLGFSFSDPNLEKILKSVQQILKADIQPPYLFINEIGTAEQQTTKNALEEKGIRVLTYNSAIGDYFEQIKLAEDQEEIKLLNAKSSVVYKFLRVIEDFDPFSDALENLEIQNQLTRSILRFDGLGSLPLEVLKSIAPFKLKRRSRYDSSGHASYSPFQPFHLETLNEEFLAFLESRKTREGEVTFKTYEDPQLPQAEQDLNKAFKALYNSDIHCIIRKNDTGTSHYKLNPVPSDKKCTCLRCLSDEMRFKALITSLNTSATRAICDAENHDEHLIEAYAYHRTGQAVKCFYALEGARNKALKEKKYVIFFIASYNQIQIRNFVRYSHEEDINEDQIDQIVQKIDKLDTHKLLYELPVESAIKQCLRYIHEDRIYRDSIINIQSDWNEIKDNYIRHKSIGYTVMGGLCSWYNLQARFHRVWTFYHKNLLLNDEGVEFYRLADIYLEAMIASYATSSRYQQRLQELPPFFFLIAIHYSSAKRLTNIFENYKVTFLKEIATTEGDVANEFMSFLDSGYDKSSFLGEQVLPNVLYHSLSRRSLDFESVIRKLFNNNLFVLQRIKIDRQQINTIVDKAINFLSVSDAFGMGGSLIEFSNFVTRYTLEIDETHLNRIAMYSLSDNIWTANLIPKFCKAVVRHKCPPFLERAFVEKLNKRIDNRREWPMKWREAIPFHSLLKDDQKVQFEKFLFASFVGGLSSDILKEGYYWKIWNPVDQPDLFKPFFESVVKQASNFPKYVISNKGYPLGSNFQPWNDLNFTVSIIYKYTMFNSEFATRLYDNLTDGIFKWVLKPGEFDYAQFNPNWILSFRSPEFATIRTNPKVIEAVERALRAKYNATLAKAYFRT